MNCDNRSKPYDKASCFMHEALKNDGVLTIYERFMAQQPQCGFGANGICCTLCTHGSSLGNNGLLDISASRFAGTNLRSVCESLNIPPCISYGGCTDIGKIVGTVNAIARELGVDIPQLPIAVSAPEYMEQKAVADAFSAVALGTLIHLAPVPPVLGSSLVTKILTEDIEGLTGGKVYVELDPLKAANGIEDHIIRKRKALGLVECVDSRIAA